MQIYDDSNSVLLREGFIQVRGVKNSMNPNDQLTYEVINKKDAVVCLVLSNDLKTIYTTKQFRPCNNNAEIGLVAGLLDKAGKDHREIIIEEIEEEIRINRNDIEKLVYVGGGFSSSGMTTEFVHRYFAVLSKDAKIDETLNKASDTDLIEKGYMPFNYDTYTKMTSNTSQLLMQEVYYMIHKKSISFNPEKIGVYGGAFSPMTVQHIYVILRAIELFNLDKVIIVPTSDKDSKKKVPYELRKRIIEASLSDLSDDLRSKIIISDVERSKISPTSFQTMSILKDEYGMFNKYYAIFGSDNISSMIFDRWEHRNELLDNFDIIAVERIGYDINHIYTNDKSQWLIKYKDKINSIPPINDNSVSSSLVRSRLFNNLTIFGFVTKTAEALILKESKTFIDTYLKV